MENDDPENKQGQTSEELRPTGIEAQAYAKANRPKKSNGKPRKRQKLSLWQNWKRASRQTQVKWVAEALLVLAAVVGAGSYIASNLQTKWNFAAEHRPRIVIGNCRIADTVTLRPELNIGHPFFVEIPYENKGQSAALHVISHRHVLFGKDYARIKIEPPDTLNINERLDPGVPVVTDAVSVQDTYQVESIYVDPSSLKPWDGTLPIVAFGRITYQGSDGTLYCTPFGFSWLNGQTFNSLAAFPPQKISVTDLCPIGSIE